MIGAMETAQRAARAFTERRRRKRPVLSGGPSGLPCEEARDGATNRDCCGWSSVFMILNSPATLDFEPNRVGEGEVAASYGFWQYQVLDMRAPKRARQ